MQCSSSFAEASLLEPLPWDTEHLGFWVARVRSPKLTDEQLDAVLCEARQTGVALVYWPASSGSCPEPGLLNCYRGGLVDRKAVFRAELTELVHGDDKVDGIVIAEAAAGPATTALLDLAVEAGRFSRFRVDPRYPRDKFESLYRLWMERSLRREIADSVLVAYRSKAPGNPLGMVTVTVTGREGVIGLIAVHKDARRQGLAGRLLTAAHGFMRQRGAIEASVVTQLANAAACRLYERAGYRLVEVTDYYHFWLHPARTLAA